VPHVSLKPCADYLLRPLLLLCRVLAALRVVVRGQPIKGSNSSAVCLMPFWIHIMLYLLLLPLLLLSCAALRNDMQHALQTFNTGCLVSAAVQSSGSATCCGARPTSRRQQQQCWRAQQPCTASGGQTWLFLLLAFMRHTGMLMLHAQRTSGRSATWHPGC
jgi:hypothetical protein